MKTLFTLLGLFFTSLLAVHSNAQDSQLTQTAKSQLPKWLAKIPIGSEVQYGFLSRKEMDNCQLGKGIQMLTLEKDEKANTKIKKLNEWRIPVVYQGDYRTLLTLSDKKGRYECVGIGGNQLAKELQGYTRYFTNNNLCLLRLYSLQIDFLVIASKNASIETGTFYPLLSAQQKMANIKDLSTQGAYTYSQLIAIVHQIEIQ